MYTYSFFFLNSRWKWPITRRGENVVFFVMIYAPFICAVCQLRIKIIFTSKQIQTESNGLSALRCLGFVRFNGNYQQRFYLTLETRSYERKCCDRFAQYMTFCALRYESQKVSQVMTKKAKIWKAWRPHKFHTKGNLHNNRGLYMKNIGRVRRDTSR